MPRSRMQYLTDELAYKVDNVRSLRSTDSWVARQDARTVLERTIERLQDDAETLHWFINRPEDYLNMNRMEFGSRFEAIMPRGPPQDKRQFSQAQREETLEWVEGIIEKLESALASFNETRENLKLLGMFYYLRR